MKRMKKYFLVPSFVGFLWCLAVFTHAQETNQHVLTVSQWLSAGPISVQKPLFYQKNNMMGKPFSPVDLLKFQQKPLAEVRQGAEFLVSDSEKIDWQLESDPATTHTDVDLALKWQAFYVQVNRYVPVKFEVTTPQDFELFVNGDMKLSNYQADGKENHRSDSIPLEPGKYLVVIKSLYQKAAKAPWSVKMQLSYNQRFTDQAVVLSTSDEQCIDLSHILLGKKLTNTQLSDDGSMVLLSYEETFPPQGKTVRWVEVKRIADQVLLFNSVHSDISQVQWVPDSHAISYVTNDGEHQALMWYNLDTHQEKKLMSPLERFSDYQWDHFGKYLIFSKEERYQKDTSGVFIVRGMEDRLPTYRIRTQLYKLSMNDLSVTPLTYGYLTNHLEDISPDDQRLLISQSFPDYTVRPYTQQVMMELNLQTFTVDTLWVTRFGGSALYSPDGKQLLVTGSPSMFNGAGNVLKKGVIPNDFDTQAYLFTIADHTVTPLTRQFNPSILQSYWNAVDQQIYFLTADGSYQDIWKLNPVNHQFQKLNNHVDVITQMSFAAKSPLLSYSGTSISSPATGWLYDLNHNTETLLSNPEKTFFEHVQFGKIENWNFVNKQGYTIEGWVYYPPHFDPTRKYPVIVYYYGGTEPTVRDCGSRYPLNLFAAMGYIVYTLNPSGSIGYGQAFSALHVNGWGKENAQDIIEGTKKFLETHSNADAQNVGCIGASYGGYMTLWLQTQTNLFKTAVDHAGISFIGSYWGQGFWGYSYSAVASANSFPWNNKNLYVDQSPLFNADKVHSSILLLQGTADTNVPTGESIQFYTAMKILGKNADLVEVKGQDHHILDYKDRILWQKTIFAWFAKYLKNEPEWWDALYPHKDL